MPDCKSGSKWPLSLLLAAVLGGTALAADQWWPPITDPPTAQRHPGRWVWAELLTRDVATAARFYGDVFGWTFETYGPADDLKTYTLASSGGVPIAGMVFNQSPEVSGSRDARWVGLMSVPDVDAAAREVTKGGGRTLFGPQALGERGRAALFTDPEGAIFGVIHSATGDPDEGVGAENQWLWVELWASDPAKMAAFYQGFGGYEIIQGTVPGESFRHAPGHRRHTPRRHPAEARPGAVDVGAVCSRRERGRHGCPRPRRGRCCRPGADACARHECGTVARPHRCARGRGRVVKVA